MKVKCIKGFMLEKYDDNGSIIPNRYYIIEEGEIWSIEEEEIDDEVRLTRDVKTGCSWMEMPKEMFKEHFEFDKYEKLTKDLIEAKEAALKYAERYKDDETENLGLTILNLKGWDEEKATEAIINAGFERPENSKTIRTGYHTFRYIGKANEKGIISNYFMFVLKSKGYKVMRFDERE